MYLKALEVNGFKSFAEKVKIDFTKGITSVVGPNGSGKSNILDAILWVLGEQSYKNIRAKESQDVIFSGGKNKKEKSFAEVSLFIDNSDFTLAHEATEIKVTRYINRKGENFYFINDVKSRLKDIQELFMDTGVGKSAYSVIGQGKVERIVGSSSLEIRSIIEEAAGIKKIKLRKVEAEKRLEKVELEIEKISYVEKELYNNYKNIAKQAEKAINYKELKSKSEILKKSIYKADCNEKRYDLGLITNKYDENMKYINELQEKFTNQEKLLEKTVEDRDLYNEKYEKLSERNKNLVRDLELLGNNRIRINERLSSLEKELKEKNEEIINQRTRKSQKEAQIEELILREEELNKVLGKEELSHQEVDKVLREKEENLENIEEQLRKSKETILDIEVEKVKYLNNLEDASKKDTSIEKRMKLLEEEISEKQVELLEIEKNYNKLLKEKENLEIEKKVTENTYLDTQKKQNEEELKLKNALKTKDDTEYNLRNKGLRLENLKRIDESNEGFFKGVKLIMNENVKGVYGPMLSLVEIPEKFMGAVESALGNSLQDIVVDSGQTAKKLIDFLKEKQGGRASFLPLDLIKPPGILFNVKTEKGVYGTANNLIKFDEKIKKAVDFIFDKVLVVDDMTVALEVQRNGNFRGTIATLSGDILSTSGRMTGGEQAKSASAQIFERKKELKKLEEELISIKEDYDNKSKIYFEINEKNNKLNEKLKELRDRKEKLANDLEDKKGDFNEKSFEYTSITKVLDTLNLEKEELLESKKEYLERKEIAEKELVRLANALEEIKKNNEVLEKNRIAEKEFLEKYKNENSDKKMAFIAKVEERKQISTMLTNYSKELSEIEEEIKRLETYISNGNLEKEEKVKESENLLVEIEEKRNNKSKENLELEGYKFRVKDLEKQEKTLIIQLKDIENELIKEENKVQNTKEKMNKLEYLIKDLEEKLKQLQEVELVELEEDITKARKELTDLEQKIQGLGYVNLLAVEEYESAKEKYEFLYNQKQDLVESKKSLETLIKEIEDTVKASFKEAYNEINNNFNYMCKEILNNSIGNLSLLDENDLLESGVELMVKFKNKKYQSLSLLSGGEKSMVAVALIMAIFMYKPSPFTFFDEIEAALDESNTKRLLGKLKEFTDKSQFILITHNKHTMKESDQLYGVTMNKEIGESKILSVVL